MYQGAKGESKLPKKSLGGTLLTFAPSPSGTISETISSSENTIVVARIQAETPTQRGVFSLFKG